MIAHILRKDATPRSGLVRRVDLAAAVLTRLVAETTLMARDFLPFEATRLRAPEDQNPLIMVHGFGCDVGSLDFMKRLLAADGWQVFPIELDTLHRTVEELAGKLGRHVERVRRRTGRTRVDVIGHSLGGLVIRYWIQMLGGYEACDRAITIGTPHMGGTWASYAVIPLRFLGYLPQVRGKSADQLTPGSEFYDFLNGPVFRVENCDRVDFTNIWSATDELLIPAWTGRFPRATRERVFLLKGHVQLIVSPTVLRYVAGVLLAPPARKPDALSANAFGPWGLRSS